MICGHGHEQKFKYPYTWNSKIIQMPYPRAEAIDQISALCPASPARIEYRIPKLIAKHRFKCFEKRKGEDSKSKYSRT